MSLKLVTLNCRGLGGLQKRRDVLNYLKQKQFSIYMSQDTHFTSDDINVVRSMWGYEVFVSPGRSDARGTAILFNNNFEFKILKQESDQIGNLLKLEVFVENKYTILLISIYGPNKYSPEFYRGLDEDIRDYQGDFIIIGWDFNLVQHTNLDYNNYKNINNPKSRDIVLQLKEKYNLTDPWRLQNEDTRRYTWFNNNPVKKPD